MLMKRFVNPIVGFLLSSPLHRLLSGVLLISVRGRRSGRIFSTPVQYVERDGDLFVISRRSRTWWRNLTANPDVTIRVRGRDVSAKASILTENESMDAYDGSSLARAARREDAVRIRLEPAVSAS